MEGGSTLPGESEPQRSRSRERKGDPDCLPLKPVEVAGGREGSGCSASFACQILPKAKEDLEPFPNQLKSSDIH